MKGGRLVEKRSIRMMPDDMKGGEAILDTAHDFGCVEWER